MKVNAGDLTDSARDLIKQGLFLQVDEDAVERTYGILSEEKVAEEDADEQMPLAGGDAADEPMPVEGGAAGAMVPRPAGAPTGPPARHRSADDKAQELAEHLLSCGVCAVLFLIVCVLCSQVQRTRMYSTSRRSPRTARARGAGGSSV